MYVYIYTPSFVNPLIFLLLSIIRNSKLQSDHIDRFEDMGRVKITLELITNDKKRNITFNRRKDGVIKKALELTTLCDVNVCMIVCIPGHQEPQIFPQDPHKFNNLINLYKQNRCKEPGKIRTYDLSDFFKDRKTKIEEELVKAKKKNMEAKYPTWFDFLNNFSEGQLREFAFGLGSKIDNVKTRVESLKGVTKIQNLDHYPFYPSTFLDVQSLFATPSLNPSPMMTMTPSDYTNLSFDPALPQCADQNNLIMHSPNPNLMTLLMNEDNDYYNNDDFSLDPPPPAYCFPSETLQQPDPPPFMLMQPACFMPDIPSQVHANSQAMYTNGATAFDYDYLV